MRKGAPCFTAVELSYLQQIVELRAQELELPHTDLFRNGKLQKSDNYSQRNRLLAYTLFAFWQKWPLEEVGIHSLAKLSFPMLKGRSEVMTLGERRFIFIGSHNLDGIRKLMRSLSSGQKVSSILVAFSKRSYEDEIAHLVKLFSREEEWQGPVYLTHFDHAKAYKFDSGILGGLNRSGGESESKSQRKIEWVNDWQKFITERDNGVQDLLVTGSFYFVGTVQRYLLEMGGSLL
jgi:dihydrofolate synthase/folylpolyglutamate synthase